LGGESGSLKSESLKAGKAILMIEKDKKQALSNFLPDFPTSGLSDSLILSALVIMAPFLPVETNMPEKIAYLTKSIFLRL
jgi:hypothetical protein